MQKKECRLKWLAKRVEELDRGNSMCKGLEAVGICPVLRMVKSPVGFPFLPQEWNGWRVCNILCKRA